MKTYGEVYVWIHVFLTSALVEVEWSASRLGRCTPEKTAPGTNWIGGWVGPRAGLNDRERRKFLTLPGLFNPDPSVVQPVGSPYTDCAIKYILRRMMA
jgi:hypothetical protein